MSSLHLWVRSMIDCKDCCVLENGSIVQRKEFGKRFAVNNPKRRSIRVCRVDGCMIDSKTKKCDFMFVVCSDRQERILLVEMKGTDIAHAVEQLISTAEVLRLSSYRLPIESYIVSSAVPKVATSYQRELVRNRKRYQAAGVKTPVTKNLYLIVD